MEDDKSEKQQPRFPPWVYAVALCGALVAAYLYRSHEAAFNGKRGNWVLLGGGCLFTFWTLSNLRSGTATLVYSSFARSDDAVGYWVAIAVEAIIAIGCFVVALGSAFGLIQ